jgi:AsmA family protein
MRRFLAILGIAGGVVLLILLAVAIAVSTVDPNNFIGPIEARVKAATGRNLTIGGGIEFKLGLEPKLVASDVHIGNPSWASGKDMLVAKKVEAEVALFPLLQRRFELLRLNLVDPVIALETNAQGEGNWEFATSSKDTSGAKAADASPGTYAIGDIAITRGALTYRDGATGAETRVVIDTLSLTARDANSPVNAEFRGQVDGIAIALTGNLGPLATLAQRRLPYPVAVQGEVAGRKASVALKLRRDDGLVELQDLDVTSGGSNVKGSVAVKHSGPRPVYTVNLTSPSLALGDLAFPVVGAPAETKGAAAAPATKKAAAGGASAHSMFSDAPVSFDAVRKNNGSGEITIAKLVLEDGRVLERVRLPFTINDGKLEVTGFQAAAFGGTLSGTLAVDARATVPAIALRLDGHQLDLGPLLAAAGVKRDVKGGKTEVSLDVAMRGDSLHKWMSGIGGRARAVVGPATLVNSKIDPSQSFDRLAQAVNPLRKVDAITELKCAVVRLPLANGVATVDRSIALETNQIDVTASGTLDFRNETLDLSFKPRLRQGITIDVSEFASLVRLRGPFAAPTVGIDAAASAATLARIGAAVSTGGLSLLGETMLKSGGAAACDVALGNGDAASPSTTSGNQVDASQPADDLGKALGKLLGR